MQPFPAEIKDQMHRTIRLDRSPKRIVSLVPSQTEYLHFLGLEEEVVGITKFCIHPECWFRTKKRVGGTKKLHLETIRKLQPDLIIGNKEENTQWEIEELEKEFPVWMSDIQDIPSALQMMRQLGELFGKKHISDPFLEAIEHRITELRSIWQKQNKGKAVYFIWKNPYMIAGDQTFIHHMLALAGYENCAKGRYPALPMEEIKKLNPHYLLLSSEPFPFKEKDILELKVEFPNCKIEIVDGELFSWYGNRMASALSYFQSC